MNRKISRRLQQAAKPPSALVLERRLDLETQHRVICRFDSQPGRLIHIVVEQHQGDMGVQPQLLSHRLLFLKLSMDLLRHPHSSPRMDIKPLRTGRLSLHPANLCQQA